MNSQEKIDDGRVDVPVDLTDDEFLSIAKMAHERDITFNQMVEKILWNYINETKSKIPTLTDEIKND